MKKGLAALEIIALAALVFGVLWYVAGGLVMVETVLLVVAIAISIAYLFHEALSCRKVRANLVGKGILRKLDIKEFSRIFGAIALLPTASIILSKYTLNSAVKPIRLYALFVLLFLVGWALGTVETAKINEGPE